MRMLLLGPLTLLVVVSLVQAQDSTESPAITVPAGVKVFAQLQRSIHTRSASAGDTVYLQTVFPVLIGDEVAIPAGTYVRATLDRAAHHGKLSGHVTLEIHVTSLIFANGYVVSVADSARAMSREGTVNASLIGALALVAGVAVGALSDGAQGATVGGGIGSAVGGLAEIVSMARGSDVAVDPGSRLEMTLLVPLTLDRERAAVPAPGSALTSQWKPRERGAHLCYMPGTPGTPDVIIPGMPGTPAIGDVPATPGTPPTVIPGTPGTLGYWYTC
jgi:type IV secretion system protein VirB10